MAEQDFGSYLANERKQAGHTLRKLSSLSSFAISTLSRWENNHAVPVRADVAKLDKALVLNGRLVTAWEFVTSGGFPAWMQDVERLEEAAESIELISPHLVPGIIQCPSYARLVFEESLMGHVSADLDRLVALRCGRYGQLRKFNDPRMTAVFPVTALTCIPEHIQREQSEHLLTLIDSGRVRVHIVPEGSILVGVTSMLLMFHLGDGGKAAVSDHVDGATLYENTTGYDRLHGLVKHALGSALPTKQSRMALEKLR